MTFRLLRKKTPTVVVVCTANITRSPFMEGLLRKLFAENPIPLLGDIRVESAGVDAVPGSPAHPVISVVAQKHGFSLGKHRSRRFDRSVASKAALVLTLEEGHKNYILERFPALQGKVFTVLEYVHGPGELDSLDIPDPTGLDVDNFREFVDTATREVIGIRERLAIHGLP